jgi:hypothetical protein
MNENPKPNLNIRPDSTIKVDINPISSELKLKTKEAFQEVVNKIKEKHLS